EGSVSKGKINRSKDKDGRANTTDIYTFLVNTTHDNTPLNSTAYINSPLCDNNSKNYSIEDTGNNTIDTNKSSTNTTINTNTTTFTNNTNNNNTITKILLKSDDKSEISRYYEDDCSIEDFVNELAVLSKEIMRWLLFLCGNTEFKEYSDECCRSDFID
ncbi:hypothetical protein CWI39_1383p0020, partial [Hamiltosporidium magnivora]